MFMRSLRTVLLTLVTLGLAGLAVAQSEPTIQQIYATAQAGQVDKARQMTQDVLRTHPKSAKAHFVMAELEASQGNTAQARDELATAESLAPGLPFARPQAVQALRNQLQATATRPPRSLGSANPAVVREPPTTPSFPWGMVLLGAAIVAVIATVLRSRAASRRAGPSVAAAGFGAAPASADWGRQAGSGSQADNGAQPGYGQQPGYAPGPQPVQPVQPGMGSRVMGGLATGLAVGAGALAAQEIGRRMMGDHGQQQGLGSATDSHGSASNSALANDAGLGSVGGAGRGGGSPLPEDFGINDTASWDDGGGAIGGDDGGSWDN